MNRVIAVVSAAVVALSMFIGVRCEASSIKIIDNPERTYKLDTSISFRMVDPLVDFIVDANRKSNKDPIYIILDSPGGSVLAGAKILDYIRASKAPVHCVVDNFAASMAAMILQNCDKRYASPSSVIMFHNASGTFEGEFPQIGSRYAAMKQLVTSMEISVADRIGMPLSKYQARIASEWWIIGAKDALKFAIVDQEAEVNMSSTQMKKQRTLLDLFGLKLLINSPKDRTVVPFDLNPAIKSLEKLKEDTNEKTPKKGVPSK